MTEERREPGPVSRAARLLRLRDVWDKILHLAGCAALSWVHSGRTGASASALGLYVAGVAALIIGGYAVNDAADHDQDLRAGKNAGKAAVPKAHSLAAAVAFLSLGTVLVLAVANGTAARALAIGTVLLGVAYSVPPIRLKERGIWGVLAGAAAQRPALFLVWAATLGARAALAVVLSLWLFFIGAVGILGHQLLDRRRDRTGSVRTFVLRNGVRPAVCLIALCAAVAALAALAPLAFLPFDQAWPLVASLIIMSAVSAGKALKASRKIGPLDAD